LKWTKLTGSGANQAGNNETKQGKEIATTDILVQKKNTRHKQ
jgi:hypothetical protein